MCACLHPCPFVCIYVCILYACVCVRVYICVYLCLTACPPARLSACLYVCLPVCRSLCVSICPSIRPPARVYIPRLSDFPSVLCIYVCLCQCLRVFASGKKLWIRVWWWFTHRLTTSVWILLARLFDFLRAMRTRESSWTHITTTTTFLLEERSQCTRTPSRPR